MKYKIFGGQMPAVTVRLDAGESVYTQSGGMAWMTDGITMDTNLKGGLGKSLGRLFSGESMFMATYTAQREADITFPSPPPCRARFVRSRLRRVRNSLRRRAPSSAQRRA